MVSQPTSFPAGVSASTSSGGRERGRYGARRPSQAIPPAEPTREPPHSAEAEEHVLACVLLDSALVVEGGREVASSPAMVRALLGGVDEACFYFPANALLWQILVRLHGRGAVLTLETLAEELKTSRQIEAVGGFAYLIQITGKTPTTAHLGYFIEKLVEKRQLREVMRVATEMVEGVYAYTGGGLDVFAPLVGGLERLERVKAKSARELPPILSWDEFRPELQTKLPDELVAGVLHKGAKLMIAGGSKSFKTWVLMHLGLAVASGLPWWGMATIKGRVLYVNLELMREFCEVRSRFLTNALKLDRVEGFDSWHLRGYARSFTELMPHFVTAMAQGQYALIILDPVYKILGDRDENANGEVAELLNEFEALARKTGAAVAYGHHHSKGNQSEKDARDRSSGAGAWTRDPDALIDMTPHAEDEHFTATFTLRNHAPKKPVVIRWEFPVMSIAPGMDPTALKKPGRTKEYGVTDILGVVVDKGGAVMYGEWLRLAKDAGVSESTFKRLLKEAVEKGKINKSGNVYSLAKPEVV